MTDSTPLLTVCIVHYRKLDQLVKTVETFEKNTEIPYGLKVFNNGYEEDGIKEYLIRLQEQPNVQVIFHPENIGCSPGRRILAQDITTPYIMMLDDDMYVNKGWDKPVFDKFRQDSTVGAIGFSIYSIDDTFDWTGGRNLDIKDGILYIHRPRVVPDESDIDFIEVDDVAAGAMVYRKELGDIIRWNDAYFIGFEDLEKGLDLKNSHYRCLVSVQSKFIHDQVSVDPQKEEYNKSRRDYHAYRRSYLFFMQNNNVRLPFTRHIFYKYVCLLPNSLLQKIVFLRLKIKK